MIGFLIGGGPTASDVMAHVAPDAVVFGINHHAAKVMPCDYLVYLDKCAADILPDQGVKISAWSDRNPDVVMWRHPNLMMSGPYGLTVAARLGCTHIVLAGMDLYQGPRLYFDDTETYPAAAAKPLKWHLDQWRLAAQLASDACPDIEIFTASPALLGIFKPWPKKGLPDE